MPKIRNWTPFLFIAGYHVLLIALLPLFITHFSWTALGLTLFTYFLGGVSITMGYHRLFSHKAYEAHPWLERVVLFFSTLAFQESALKWSHDHRRHHKYVDTDDDPYSIEKGFWYAHMGWLFTHERKFDPTIVRDLLKNPRVVFQDNHMLALTLVSNGLVFALSCLFVHPLAAFYGPVLLRIFAIHHCTWFINSLAHTWGARTYVRELSAVDNAVLAVLTFGEGYHNYHHAFAADYRNGIRWYHYDVTKWLIWTASKLGLAHKLRSVSDLRVRQQLVKKDKELFLSVVPPSGPQFAALRERAENLARSFDATASDLNRRLLEMRRATTERQHQIEEEFHRLQGEVQELRARLQEDWEEWKALTRQVAATGLLPSH
ncbi:MAG: fatty acid desaturase [Opitutales bacterium]